MLKSLNVDKHLNETCLKRAKRGFNFLGFRIPSTSIQPSAASVSRRDKKVTRLYEQGTSKRRIGLYLGQWLMGCGLLLSLPSVSFAGNCALYNASPNGCSCFDTGYANTMTSDTWQANGAFFNNIDQNILYCADDTDTICAAPRPASLANNSRLHLKNTSPGAVDDYFYCDIVHNSNWQAVKYTPAVTAAPQNIPVTGPFGLLAIILGMGWVGKRRIRG